MGHCVGSSSRYTFGNTPSSGIWTQGGVSRRTTSKVCGPLSRRPVVAEVLTDSSLLYCRFVLANGRVLHEGKGRAEALEIFELIIEGQVRELPLVPSGTLPKERPSAAMQAMEVGEIVVVDTRTPDRFNMSDWQVLHLRHGIGWLMASPLCCQLHECTNLLGAVVVAGKGTFPTVNPEWLHEWSCEMAHCIAHSSISVMESSLDMLRLVFPPEIVERLVLNVINAHTPSELADVLDEIDRARLGLPFSSNPPSIKSSVDLDSSRPRRASFDVVLQNGRGGLKSVSSLGSSCQRSMSAELFSRPSIGYSTPFAAAMDLPVSGRDSMSSGAGQPPMSGRTNSLGQLAVSMLRQVSGPHEGLDGHSDTPDSPSPDEVFGYEDILLDDHQQSLKNKPSQSLDRASSRQSESSLQTGDGSPLRLSDEQPSLRSSDEQQQQQQQQQQHARRVSDERPPMPDPVQDYDDVIIPRFVAGSKKSTLSSPQMKQASSSSKDRKGLSSSTGSPKQSSGRQHQTSRPLLSSILERYSSGGSTALHSSNASSLAGMVQEHSSSIPLSSRQSHQGFDGWIASQMILIDQNALSVWAILHASYCLVHANLLQQLLGPTALMIPGVLAFFVPEYWAEHRTFWLSIHRFAAVILQTARLALFRRGAIGTAVVHSISLAVQTVCHPLPLNVHIPVELSCLWIMAFTLSISHVADGNNNLVPLVLGLLIQLLGGALDTLRVRLLEKQMRRKYVERSSWH